MVGDNLCTANIAWNADDIRTNPMGFQSSTQMGRCMGEVDNTLSDCTFLWCNALFRRILCAIAI